MTLIEIIVKRVQRQIGKISAIRLKHFFISFYEFYSLGDISVELSQSVFVLDYSLLVSLYHESCPKRFHVDPRREVLDRPVFEDIFIKNYFKYF